MAHAHGLWAMAYPLWPMPPHAPMGPWTHGPMPHALWPMVHALWPMAHGLCPMANAMGGKQCTPPPTTMPLPLYPTDVLCTPCLPLPSHLMYPSLNPVPRTPYPLPHRSLLHPQLPEHCSAVRSPSSSPSFHSSPHSRPNSFSIANHAYFIISLRCSFNNKATASTTTHYTTTTRLSAHPQMSKRWGRPVCSTVLCRASAPPPPGAAPSHQHLVVC